MFSQQGFVPITQLQYQGQIHPNIMNIQSNQMMVPVSQMQNNAMIPQTNQMQPNQMPVQTNHMMAVQAPNLSNQIGTIPSRSTNQLYPIQALPTAVQNQSNQQSAQSQQQQQQQHIPPSYTETNQEHTKSGAVENPTYSVISD